MIRRQIEMIRMQIKKLDCRFIYKLKGLYCKFIQNNLPTITYIKKTSVVLCSMRFLKHELPRIKLVELTSNNP
jgi:hypothetical protein